MDDGDRWSDIDLTFAVSDNIPIIDVLEDWSHNLESEFDGVHLAEIPSIGYFCYPDVYNSICRSRQHPKLEQPDLSLDCSFTMR